MKKVFLIAIFAALLSACKSTSTEKVTTAVATDSTAVKVDTAAAVADTVEAVK